MKKMLIVFALVALIFVSGCVKETENSEENNVVDNTPLVNIVYYQDSCRENINTDCMLSYCSNTPDEKHCMNTIQTDIKMRCDVDANLVSEKNYDACGCYNKICSAK